MSGFPGRCGCSRRRRPPPPARSWARVGSRPTILPTLPGAASSRAAAFAAFGLPIARFPSAEHLYSATGLAPACYRSATLNRRGRVSRQGLPEHRDALMNLAWGLSHHCGVFIEHHRELRARGMRPIQARFAFAGHACRLAYTLLKTQRPGRHGLPAR